MHYAIIFKHVITANPAGEFHVGEEPDEKLTVRCHLFLTDVYECLKFRRKKDGRIKTYL